MQDVIGAVCEVYGIGEETLISAGKARPASEARAAASMLVQDMGNLTLASPGRVLGRKIATLSKSANRAKERSARDKKFRQKTEMICRNCKDMKKHKCQA